MKSVAAAAALLLAACAPPPDGACLETAPLLAGALDESRVYAFATDVGARVVGRPGAAPAGADVRVGAETTRADDLGAFEFSFDTSTTVNIETAGQTAEVRVRAQAEGCVAGAPSPTGTLPNDVALARCGGADLVLVPTTADGAVQRFDEDAAPLDGIALPLDDDGRGPEPFHVATGGARAVVSLFGQHRAALVDPCGGALLHVAAPPETTFAVAPPVELASPIDVDGDGEPERSITAMRPRHPQGVAVVGERALVAFTGLLEVSPTARFGPAVVVAYDIVGDQLTQSAELALPCENPQALALDGDDLVWASCSGVLDRVDGRFQATSDGALVALTLDPLAVERVVPLGRFAPGTPAFTESSIVVGSLVRAEVLVLPLAATDREDGVTLSLGGDETESIFEVLALPGDLALASVFGRDHLRVVDARAAALDPAPFSAPIRLADDGPARGTAALAGGLRPDGRLRAFALLGLSAEIVPLDLQQWAGP
jgi:hypothetical protein